MELRTSEINSLREIVKTWQSDESQELEASFGGKGTVDISTFYNVITRLQSKGFNFTQEDDKLNIITLQGIRFTLSGYGVIKSYCENNVLPPSYSVMEKKTTVQNSKLLLEEYDTFVKIKDEIILESEPAEQKEGVKKATNNPQVNELVKTWPVQKKAFRLIRRWSCIDETKRFRFDLSIVHQTSRNSKGQFIYQTDFTSENILRNNPVYEIEVELLHSDANKDVETSLKNLITGIGEVLRGIQKNTLLIRKTMYKNVKRQYVDLIRTQVEIFRGVNPETLQIDNMREKAIKDVPNIRNNFNVTDKADGLRVMIFCNKEGEIFLLDMSLNVYRTGLKSVACAESLLDAEWITKSRKGEQRQNVYAFDIYYGLGGKDVTGLPFVQSNPDKKNEDRQTKLAEWFTAFNTSQQSSEQSTNKKALLSQFILGQKKFFHGEMYKDIGGIFKACEECLKATRNSDYYTDGLILTSNDERIPEKSNVSFRHQFKWKPSIDNTIDFLVKFQKDDEGKDMIVSENGDDYKILRLFVAGSDDYMYNDPQGAVLNKTKIELTPSKKLKPVLFTPSDYTDPLASVCYRKVYKRPGTEELYITCEVKEEKDENMNLVGQDMSDPDVIQAMGEPIQDGSIIEMRYEASESSPVKRWIPIRVRNDKTERFRSGVIKKTMNTDYVANSNWNSIFNPITYSMITTGSEIPLPSEIEAISSIKADKVEAGRKYYDKDKVEDNKTIIKTLSEFHNHWIKYELLLRPTLKVKENETKKTLLDIACGKAGDGFKWIDSGVGLVLGIDSAGDNITNNQDGAYRRYINFVKRRGGQENVPPMIFVIGDSSVRSFANGEAGKTDLDKDILRALFHDEASGKGVPPKGAIPDLIKDWKGSLSKGADVVACMFAVHYFFESKEKFSNLLENIKQSLNIGGYFIGCCFDGKSVFNFLKDKLTNDPKVGKTDDKKIIWELTKKYDTEEKDIPIGTGEQEDTRPVGFGLEVGVKFISIGLEHNEYLVPFELLVEQMAKIGCRLLNEEEYKELGLTASTRLFKEEIELLKKQRIGKKYEMKSPLKEFSELNRWFIFKRTKESGTVTTPVKVLPATEETALAANESAAPENSLATAIVKVDPFDPTLEWEKDRMFIFGPAIGTNPGTQKTYGVYNPSFILSLAALFDIPDEKDSSIVYPSIEAYLVAMKFKLASKNKNEQSKADAFTKAGSYYTTYLTSIQKFKQPTLKDLIPSINEYTKNIREEVRKSKFNDTKWDEEKDELVQYALQYRFNNDKEFRSILEKTKTKNLYLLYTAYDDLIFGGKYESKKVIGENRVGKYLMELAKYTPLQKAI